MPNTSIPAQRDFLRNSLCFSQLNPLVLVRTLVKKCYLAVRNLLMQFKLLLDPRDVMSSLSNNSVAQRSPRTVSQSQRASNSLIDLKILVLLWWNQLHLRPMMKQVMVPLLLQSWLEQSSRKAANPLQLVWTLWILKEESTLLSSMLSRISKQILSLSTLHSLSQMLQLFLLMAIAKLVISLLNSWKRQENMELLQLLMVKHWITRSNSLRVWDLTEDTSHLTLLLIIKHKRLNLKILLSSSLKRKSPTSNQSSPSLNMLWRQTDPFF